MSSNSGWYLSLFPIVKTHPSDSHRLHRMFYLVISMLDERDFQFIVGKQRTDIQIVVLSRFWRLFLSASTQKHPGCHVSFSPLTSWVWTRSTQKIINFINSAKGNVLRWEPRTCSQPLDVISGGVYHLICPGTTSDRHSSFSWWRPTWNYGTRFSRRISYFKIDLFEQNRSVEEMWSIFPSNSDVLYAPNFIKTNNSWSV